MNERDLFFSALEIEDPAARRAHLQSACGENLELLSRVESLLASHEGASRFMQTPVVEQLGDEIAATIVMRTGSTYDEALSQSQERNNMDEEIPLGYLEPSTKPGSLGRLAHYEILEIVGHGAFGTVLRAFDEKLQRVVAIKVMAPELAATSPARKRFIREAQNSAQIRHENVVSVYSVEEKPIPYLVMEFIPGLTLQARLDERGPLDVPTVLRLGAQIAHGLAAAHAKDLIHRDIKPGNILLETGMRDRVKITDFGLARAADDASMTQSGTIAGTPMYMAPEQALGHKLDQRADLFSFGSVLYQMVSGGPPFRAASTLAALKRVTEDTPRPIQEIIPETPQWMCDIISKLHAKNPDERFQSAMEVANILERHLAHLQNPSQIARPAAVARHRLFRDRREEKPRTGPEHADGQMRPLMVPQGIRWPLLIATGIMFLAAVLLLAVTGSTGVTHLFSGARVVQGPSPPIVPKPEPIADEFSGVAWKQLFNGKNLDGWAPNPDFPGHWRVEEGILIGAGSQLGMLQTSRNDIEDFHFRAEVLINSAEADGGIFFRSLPQSSNELNLCFDPKLPTQQTGSLVIHKPSTKDSVWNSAPKNLAKANDWMTVEIIARGGQAVTKVNGQTAAESQNLCGNPRGHIVLQHLGPQTVVRFRKIEIKELPSPESLPSVLAKRRFGSDEWIDVIPLIDTQLDKWDVPKFTGKNAWRMEQGELVVGGDALPSKLLLPLDSDWPAFECELEFTRRFGNSGLNVNIPTARGECPLLFDPAGISGAYLGARAKGVLLKAGPQLTTGQRTTIRFDIRRQQEADQIAVALNGATVGKWTGDRNAIAYSYQEGFPHDRRVSLWIHGGGNEFVFHRIRVRILDGGTAQTLRLVAPASWTQIFNGRDLAGWSTAQPGAWSVQDGVLVGKSDSPSMLLTKRDDYANFHLKAEAKVNGAGNSGIWFRHDPKSPFKSYEAQISCIPGSKHQTGSLLSSAGVGKAALLASIPSSPVAPDTWFTLEVLASGDDLTVKVNGETTASFRDGTYTRGQIGLELYGKDTHVEFRKIEIMELKAHPLAPATPPAVVTPFVILAKDAATEQKFATLAQAVSAAQERDTIEIRGNGPIPTDPLVVNKALTLRAAAGFRPVLVHTQDGSLLWAKAPLTLEGLELHSLGNKHKVKESQVALVQTTQQPLRIANCRFVVTGELVAIQTYASPLLEVVRSEIFSQDHNSIDLGLADKVKLVVKDCTLAGRGAVAFYQNGKPCQDAEIEFTGNTFVAAEWFTWSHRFFHEPVGAGQEPFRSLSIKAAGNVFQSRRSFAGVIHADAENPFRSAALCDWYRAHVAWEGHDNLYAVQGLYLICHEGDKAPEQQWNTLKDWNDFWKAGKDSGTEGTPLFAGGDLIERIGHDPLKLTAADFRLKQGSPGQGSGPNEKDSGANIDLVGPGEPLEKAKNAAAAAALLALREVVAEKERFRDEMKQSHVTGQSSALDVIYTEINLIEARIHLAQTEGNAVACIAAFRCLVPFRERERELVAQQVTAGLLKEESLLRADSSLTDAKGRLGKAIVDAPASAFFTAADVQRIAALPAAQQIEEVRKELQKRNPNFDGKFTPTIDNDVVTGLELITNDVADISPIRAFSALTTLNCRGTAPVRGMLSDLAPLKGLPLRTLNCRVTGVADLKPLKGMPLTHLYIDITPVADLAPLEGMSLKELNCSYTQVSTLTPLKGMPLAVLWCNNTEIANLDPVKEMPLDWITIQNTKVKDHSPLKGRQLTQIHLDFDPQRDGELLRSLTTLTRINDKPAEEFWKDNGK